MAYYAYKRVRDLIPESFQEPWEEAYEAENGCEYDGDPGYDGSAWDLAADYVVHLHREIAAASTAMTQAVRHLESAMGPHTVPEEEALKALRKALAES